MSNNTATCNKRISEKKKSNSSTGKSKASEVEKPEDIRREHKAIELKVSKEYKKAKQEELQAKKELFFEKMSQYIPVNIHGVLHFARKREEGVWEIISNAKCREQAERFYPEFNGKTLHLYSEWKSQLGEPASGVVFKPCSNLQDYIYKENPKSSQFYINLFTGFNKPSIKGECTKFLDFVLHYICQDNVACFNKLIGFFAHILQHPEQRTALTPTIRGRQGTGKTMVMTAFASVLDKQYVSVPCSNDITGQFNGILENKLLIVADEATFAGDWNTINRLKSITGNETLTINHKGIDAYDVDNFARVVIVTNKDMAAPIEYDNRRYFLVQTADKANPEVYDEVFDELNNGGREALKYFLEHYDLSEYNPHKCEVFFEEETKEIQFETMLKTDIIGAYIMDCQNDEVNDSENIFKAIETDGFCPVDYGFQMVERWKMSQGCKTEIKKKSLSQRLKQYGITVETKRRNPVSTAKCYIPAKTA